MLFEEFKIFRKHKRQFVPDLRNAELSGSFRGRPVIEKELSAKESLLLEKLCPTGAIEANPFTLDLGRCVFCNECHFAFPEKINFTNDYKIATNQRDQLKISSGDPRRIYIERSLVRAEVRSIFSNALKLRQVSAGGDNSCEMELNAAGNVNFDMGRYGIEFVASPRHADGMVITGPITQNMSKALEITWTAIPEPKILVLAGTDAISGGIFAGSEEINRTFLESHHVDLYIPGNPMHPLTFINGILDLTGRV
jgi:Ni,Fe-hydrogenase III small subunit